MILFSPTSNLPTGMAATATPYLSSSTGKAESSAVSGLCVLVLDPVGVCTCAEVRLVDFPPKSIGCVWSPSHT